MHINNIGNHQEITRTEKKYSTEILRLQASELNKENVVCFPTRALCTTVLR